MVLALVCIVIGLMIAHWPYQYEPPSVPTAPPFLEEDEPCRPHWIAEIRVGKHKPPRKITVEAETEAQAVMKLMTPPWSFSLKDIQTLRPGR
jgi:hypothetical protein